MIKVTIIIPIYNRANTIKTTLNSILQQTHSYIEIILIDDYSNDYEQLKILVNSYNDKRVILIRNNKNMNGAYSRNIGIKKATGKYIAFMDSDDTWELNKIEVQLKFAESIKNDQFLITCKSKVIRRKFIEILPKNNISTNEKISDFLFVNDGYMPTPSLFLPSVIAKNNLFNESLRRHQDYDFLMKLEYKGINFYTLDDVLVTVYANHAETSEKRGANYKISEYFLYEYDKYFTTKSKNYFWLKNIGFYMSRNGKKSLLFKELFFDARYKYIKLKDLIIYITYFITINTKLYNIIEKVYLKLKEKNEK